MSNSKSKIWKSDQARRLKVFEERKSDELRNYFKTSSFDSEFVTIHPMADEDWWFKKFNENPEICKSVDLYWKFDGDVAFVEIWSSEVLSIELFARWRSEMLYLSAKVNDDLIYSKTVEFVLQAFWKEHLKENLFQKFYLKAKHYQIK